MHRSNFGFLKTANFGRIKKHVLKGRMHVDDVILKEFQSAN
jgi:hypothetical protein